MSATSCPATSSITTNCGSLIPEPRQTNVAAGIPISVTAAAATTVASVRLPAGMRELASPHKIIVDNEPQVPGPGLSRPTPKKVAVKVAHNGAGRKGSAAPRSTVPAPAFISPRPLLQGYLAGPLPRHPKPAKKLHKPRSPISPDQSNGSGRCKKGSPHP